jgi:hypothetical protein
MVATIKITEIIDLEGNIIDTIEGHLNFQASKTFHLSIREPHPRTIEKYMEINNGVFPQSTLKSVVDEVIDKCRRHHIMIVQVVKSDLSISIDYGFNVTEPKVKEVLTLTVVEVED